MWAIDNFVLDASPIGAGVTNYIKGGFDSLRVGAISLEITSITEKTVGYTFTADDLY